MKKRYWDSNVWLGILKAEPDKLETCSQLFEQAKRREFVIVSSALTFTEVVHLQGHTRLDASIEETITAFFEYDFIKIVSVDRATAELARKLVWQFNDESLKPRDRLKPKDAIHVATAILANVDVLNSYNPDLTSLNGHLTCKNGNPLKIEPPIVVQQPLIPFPSA